MHTLLTWNPGKLCEASMDRGGWRATVLGVSESDMTKWLTHTLPTHRKSIRSVNLTAVKNIVSDGNNEIKGMKFTCVSPVLR